MGRWDQVRLGDPIIQERKQAGQNNYRGVCLLSMCSRILARAVATRLRIWAETIDLIDENQAGFRTGRATADATQMIVRINEETEKYGKVTDKENLPEYHPTATLLDITKAYPRVNRPILWHLLRKCGM